MPALSDPKFLPRFEEKSLSKSPVPSVPRASDRPAALWRAAGGQQKAAEDLGALQSDPTPPSDLKKQSLTPRSLGLLTLTHHGRVAPGDCSPLALPDARQRSFASPAPP